MAPLALVAALVCAALMGLAIQRGGICMVAAVEQAATTRRFTRALGLFEAAVCITAVLCAAMLAGIAVRPPPDFALAPTVVAGGVLLGLGASLNGACLLGTIARLGSGDWHYGLTPAGFFLGSLGGARLAVAPAASPPMQAPAVIGFGAVVVLALLLMLRRRGPPAKGGGWLANHATLAIGLLSGLLLLLAGSWAYSDVLARLARGMEPALRDYALFAVLFAGAIAGGARVSGGFALRLRSALACLAGGALMGLGGALAPGGNDSLVLFGLPVLRPFAWLAITAMALTIWAALSLRRRFGGAQ